MNSPSSPERAAGCSRRASSAGARSAASSGTRSARRFSLNECGTEISTSVPSLAISAHSSVTGTPIDIGAWLMSLLPGSHASRSRILGRDVGRMTRAINGRRLPNAFASYDPASRSWKTSQLCLPLDTSTPSSATWPTAGMTRDGNAYRLPRSVDPFGVSAFGLWPSPTRAMGRRGWGVSRTGRHRYSPEVVKRALSVGYKPHPELLEALMGWPITWTELKPLETDRFRQWLLSHGGC